MTIERREQIERQIARAVIQDAIKAGYTVDVYDGAVTTVKASSDLSVILGAMFTTGEDYLILSRDGGKGWVRFIYGNEPWYVVADYTTNLDGSVTARADMISERLEQRGY